MGETAEKVRTVVDYANDLREVFSRAFEIRFGQQERLEEVAEGWQSIADAAEDAQKAIDSANEKNRDLTDDRKLLEYQLEIAVRYGDQEKASRIREKIAKIDKEMSENQETIAESQETVTRNTEGNSKAAIENREALRGQLSSYSDLVEMYAKTGLKGDELKAKVAELKEEFRQQGLEAGYSDEQLQPYMKSFEDMTTIINEVPRKVTVEFDSNVSAAKNAVNEYLARVNAANKTVNTNFTTSGGINPNAARIQTLLAMTESLNQSIQRGELDATGRRWTYAALFDINKELKALGHFAEGGYVTGPGTSTSDSIPAMLSKGEYVIKASAVGAYGVDFMNAINEQKVGRFSAATSAPAQATGSSVVYLSEQDRMLLKTAIDRPVTLYTTDKKIAESANAGNKELARRGSR
jgi:hypothetical protein